MLKEKTVTGIVKNLVDSTCEYVGLRESKFNTAKSFIYFLPRIQKEFKICISAYDKKEEVKQECRRVNRLIFDYEIKNAMANEEL